MTAPLLAELDASIAENPGNWQARLARAELYLESGEALSALRDLELAADQAPEATLLPMARVLLELGAAERALRQVDRAIEVSGSIEARIIRAIVLRDLGDSDAAIEELQELVATAPENLPAVEQLALQLLATEQPEAALERATEALARGLDSALLRLAAGAASARLPEQSEQGLRHLRRALELQPPDPGRVHLELGSLLASSGRHEEALQHLEEATRLLPDLADAHFRLATTQRAIGELDGARRSLERFEQLRANAEQAEDRARLAGIALNEAQQLATSNQLPQARERIEEILQSFPQHSPTLLLAAKVDASLGELRSAHARLSVVRAADPGSVEAHFLDGILLRQLGQSDEARVAFEQALSIDPELGEAHAVLGGIQLQSGEAADAVRSFERALELGVDGAQLRLGYSRALKAVGDEDRSREQLQRAQQFEPSTQPPGR